MAEPRHFEISEVGGVTVVRFNDERITDEAYIQELGRQLIDLVEQENRSSLCLNFANVEFLSSAMLGKLNTLDKRVKAQGGKMKLCNIRPHIYQAFLYTRLHEVFDIRDDEADALAAF